MFATIAGCVCSKTDQPLRDQGEILQQLERSTAESSISSTDKLIMPVTSMPGFERRWTNGRVWLARIELGIETETVNVWLFARNTIWSSQTLSSSAMNTTRRKWTRLWQDCNIRSQKLLKKTKVPTGKNWLILDGVLSSTPGKWSLEDGRQRKKKTKIWKNF